MSDYYSLNQITIAGNIGYVKSNEVVGKDVLNFSVATTDAFKDSKGELKKTTDWHNVTVWGNHAKALANVLGKGCFVVVTGKQKVNEKDGNKYPYIAADRVIAVNSKN